MRRRKVKSTLPSPVENCTCNAYRYHIPSFVDRVIVERSLLNEESARDHVYSH